MIELWHEWNSVHSFRVRIVLAEKRLAWVDRTVELITFEHLRPGYLKVNPDGTVPTLVHDGEPVYDSSVICEYLDEVFPDPPLAPANPRMRASMRRWSKIHDELAHPALRDISFQLLFKPLLQRIPLEALVERLKDHPRPERRAKFLAGAHANIDWAAVAASLPVCVMIARRIDMALTPGPWIVGDNFTLADVAMAPFAERVRNLGMSFVWDVFPRGARWSERVLARDSVARSCPPDRYRLPPPGDQHVAELRRIAESVAG